MKQTGLRRRPRRPEYPSDVKYVEVEVEVTCTVCGESFTYKARGGFRRKTCSPRCESEAKRQRMRERDRKGDRNPNYRHGNRAGDRDREGERKWYVAAAARCAHPTCPAPDRSLQLHHVVYRQHVRKAGGDEWDPRNALTLCARCHLSHHRFGRVFPLVLLPDVAIEFAFELLGPAAGIYLPRRYSGPPGVRCAELITATEPT